MMTGEVLGNLAVLFILLGIALALLISGLCVMLGWSLLHPPRTTEGVAIARGWPVDPGETGFEFRSWTLDRPDGARLPVWEIVNPNSPDGPVALISHCWGGSRFHSLQRVPFVYACSSRVIVMDMRGHGDSTGCICGLGTSEVGDLVELISRTAPSQQVILYGYSLGAGVSICAATDDTVSDRVIAVIADGPYRWVREPVLSMLRVNRLPAWPILPIVHRAVCMILPGLRASERAQYASRLRCPLLVLHGTDDPICPIVSALEVAGAAQDCEFVVVPGGGHLDLHETDAARYLQTFNTFMTRCIAQAAPPGARD